MLQLNKRENNDGKISNLRIMIDVSKCILIKYLISRPCWRIPIREPIGSIADVLDLYLISNIRAVVKRESTFFTSLVRRILQVPIVFLDLGLE